MKKIVLIFILFFAQFIHSQETNSYHVVANGETLSSIAQRYKITPYDIIQLNPNVVNGVKEKDVLIIPKSAVVSHANDVNKLSSNQSSAVVSNAKNQNVLTHIVQPKETKFGLAKLYGVTIPELELQNPQIVAGLQIGHKLQIKGATTGFKQDLAQVGSTVVFDSKFEYVVLPGETLYGISKRNGLTVDELTKVNSSVLNGVLKSGQKLSIPVRKGNSMATNSEAVSTNSNYHLVEPKETKFGLSKKYGVTIEQLERLNPQIVKGLQIGQKIAIPSSYKGVEVVVKSAELKTEPAKSEIKPTKTVSSQEYVSYEIQPKETLFGLSKKAGMTVKDLVDLNPKLSEAVQVGMVIKMPKNTVIESNKNDVVTSGSVVDKVKPTEVVAVPASKTVTNSSRKDLIPTLVKTDKKQIAFIAPFNEENYQDYLKSSPDFKYVNNEFVKKNLDFYSGALRAIDSAKVLGLNVDVKLVQEDKDSLSVEALKNEVIGQSNLVLVPFYEKNAQKIASNIESQHIPVVTNQFLGKANGLSNLYLSFPSEVSIRNAMLDYLKQANTNIIVVNSPNRTESKKAILEKFPEAKFVKLSDRVAVDTDDLKSLLVKGKLNYVILDTDKSSMIISSTNVLLNELTDFQIQIVALEPSLLSNYQNVSSIRVTILKMIYPSYASIEKTSQLDASVQKMTHKNAEEVTADFITGFDVTFDALLRLFQDKGFEKSANEDVTEYLKLKFEYNKDTNGNYFNKGFYILQHDTDKVKVLN